MIYTITDLSRAQNEEPVERLVYIGTDRTAVTKHFTHYYACWSEIERDYIYEAEVRAYEDGWNLCDNVPDYEIIAKAKSIV